jgi:hypothetical protein
MRELLKKHNGFNNITHLSCLLIYSYKFCYALLLMKLYFSTAFFCYIPMLKFN